MNAPNPHCLPSSVVQDDEHLVVAAAKAGDLFAFEELVNRYERKILRLARNITGNKEDAEDVMQDAFLKSYANLHLFQGGSRFYTWLVRIAVNESLMKLRKRRPGEFSIDEIPDSDDILPRELDDWGPSPEQRYAQQELREILKDAIEKLPPDFRTVLVLRDMEELSIEETATLLGMSVSAVKSRLLRARLKVRQRLNRVFGEGSVQ